MNLVKLWISTHVQNSQVADCPTSAVEVLKTTVCDKVHVDHFERPLYSPNCVVSCKDICAPKHNKRQPRCSEILHEVGTFSQKRGKFTLGHCPNQGGGEALARIWIFSDILDCNFDFSGSVWARHFSTQSPLLPNCQFWSWPECNFHLISGEHYNICGLRYIWSSQKFLFFFF